MRSCVSIKYNYMNILVFEKENIVVYGCKNKKDILDSYEYIVSFLEKNIKYIQRFSDDKILKTIKDIISTNSYLLYNFR
jgi:TATA-box binding protein (TBP) (component of TFIID and TFIIIB)